MTQARHGLQGQVQTWAAMGGDAQRARRAGAAPSPAAPPGLGSSQESLLPGGESGRGELLSSHRFSAEPLLPRFPCRKSSPKLPSWVLSAGDVEVFSASSVLGASPEAFWSWKGAS